MKGISLVSNTLSPKEVLFSGINQLLVTASQVPPANPLCGSYSSSCSNSCSSLSMKRIFEVDLDCSSQTSEDGNRKMVPP